MQKTKLRTWLEMLKVQNNMRKQFTADTQSALVADWFDIFP